MKNFLPRIIPLLFFIVISGCASVGQPFNAKKVLDIEKGKTHKSAIFQWLGPPWRKGIDSGMLTWTYAHYYYSAFSPLKSEDLVIKFDAEGIVKSYTFNTSEEIPKR